MSITPPPPPPTTQSRTDSLTLRGGRLRKTSRGVLTFAPFLATASALTLAALLSLAPTHSAHAQTTCTGTAPAFICRGTATASETLRALNAQTLMVTDEDGFSISISSGNEAFRFTSVSGSTGMTIDLDGNITNTDRDGVYASHSGTGAVSITTDGTITAGDDGMVVFASNTAATTLDIMATGTITALDGGIYATHSGTGALTITTGTINDDNDTRLGGAPAIDARLNSANSAGISITTGNITASHKGIYASATDAGTTGSIRINANGNISARRDAIEIDTAANNDITVSISGMVDATTTTNPRAILMTRAGTTGATRLIMNTGAAIADGDTVSAMQNSASTATADTDATLELAADAGDTPSSFPLDSMENFTGFTYFEKTGAGTWTLTGEQPSGKAFTSAILRAGTLHLSTATIQLGSTSLAMSADTTLSVSGTNTIMGGLNSNAGGNISLATGDAVDASDRLTVTGAVSAGGTVTLDADLTGTTPAADSLVLDGAVTGSVTVSLRVAATENMTAAPVALISGTSASGVTLAKATSAPCTISGAMCDFTLSGTMATITVSGLTSTGPVTPMPPEPMDMIVADACTEQDATPGRFICAGTVMATQTLAAEASEALIITDHDAGSGFSISTDSGNAFTLTTVTESMGMSIDIDGDITTTTSGAYAIHATHQGSGEISITTGGTIMATSGTAIRAFTGGSATAMTITNSGSITAGGDTASRVGVSVALSAANGNLEITNSGSITVTNGAAVRALHDGDGGNVTVTNSGSISGSTGISAEISDPNDMNSMGAISVTIGANASVTGTDATNGHAIRMQGGATQRLILHAGAEFMGTIIANYDRDTTDNIAAMPINATLELSGTGDATLPLAGLAGVDGFTSFEKSGSGTWTFIGNQPMDRVFTQTFATAVISEGTLRLGDGTTATTLRPGTATLTIGAEGTLEAAGMVTITGAVDNSAGGSVSLALADDTGADDSLTVMGNFTGAVTLDADLTGITNAIDSLVLNGSGANSVTINLRVTGDINNLQPDGLALLSASSTATNVTLTEGTCTIGNRECVFTLDEATGQSLATLAIVGGGAVTAVVENYAASLADIAALSGLATRQANRHYATDNTERGFWAQIAAGQTDTTPSFSSTGSSRDTGITRARFGLDAPLPLADLPLENLAIGANFWLAQTDSDITSRNGKGDIETDAFGFAASATLEHSINLGGAGGGGNAAEGGSAPRKNGNLYADAQLQHASFSSDLKAEGESVQSNHDATSWGAALELGYKLPPALHGIVFTPQAQLTWSSVDFDAFTDAADERIAIADGETLSARLGIAAESPLNLAGFGGAGGTGATAGSFRAALDVLLPLDGKTATNLGDSRLLSDMQDPALSLTAGGIFPLNATTILAADLATTQSDETETYRASISAHFSF